jgi:hypothetical protein
MLERALAQADQRTPEELACVCGSRAHALSVSEMYTTCFMPWRILQHICVAAYPEVCSAVHVCGRPCFTYISFADAVKGLPSYARTAHVYVALPGRQMQC